MNTPQKQKGRVMNAAFLSTTVFWLPDLDSNQDLRIVGWALCAHAER